MEMDSEYTKRLKKFIGKPENGRSDHFNLTQDEAIDLVKEKLKNNFSCNLWTYELNDKEIESIDNQLTEAGISHVFDEVFDAVVCFKSDTDMYNFYDKLRKESSEEILEFLRKHNYNTPVINFYDK